jgi:phosphoribosylanthranilate isomerase
MKIKVCGMRDAENIREVEALGIDMMGFIFWPKSRRYVSERPEYLPKRCQRVGVFVDEDINQVKRIANDFALDFIQLHGSESPAYISRLLDALQGGASTPSTGSGTVEGTVEAVSIIKAFNIATAEDLEQTKAYEGIADYYLFDTKATLPGGSGQQFDWSVLDAYNGNTPFLLSGGIGPNDAERVKAFLTSQRSLRPLRQAQGPSKGKCIGIDLNSRFELAPGLKGVDEIKRFLEKVRK